MRKMISISIIFFFLGLVVIGQPSTIYTPWGTPVTVSEQGDMTPSQRATWDQEHSDYQDSGAFFHRTLIGDANNPWPSSTSTFNCHAYAWHMSLLGELHEFDDPYIMTDTEAEKYFDDPSYMECTKAEADVWWINNGAHSALAVSTTDWLKSKWGTGPLATHHKDNQPTTITSVTYYKECSQNITTIYSVNATLSYCSVKLSNSSVAGNVDLEIEFEKAIQINGTFTTGSGATLDLHPE